MSVDSDKAVAKLRKFWALEDWKRDIASYAAWHRLYLKYNSKIALERLAAIKARWPGKEHLFDWED